MQEVFYYYSYERMLKGQESFSHVLASYKSHDIFSDINEFSRALHQIPLSKSMAIISVVSPLKRCIKHPIKHLWRSFYENIQRLKVISD